MFNQRAKTPLTKAIALLDQALEIADVYRRAKHDQLNHEDLQSIERLRAALWAHHCALEHKMRALGGQISSGSHFPELE